MAHLTLVSLAAILAPLGAARAAELVTERQIPLAIALDGASAAVEGCLAQNYRIAVTVVDRGGQVRATLRGRRRQSASPRRRDA